MKAIYVTDIHGKLAKFILLRDYIIAMRPSIVFMGGDIFPNGHGLMANLQYDCDDFVNDFLVNWCRNLRTELDSSYPKIFMIMGNDDTALDESLLDSFPELWTYCHDKIITYNNLSIMGYNCIPPSPFLNKDWERYDVSQFVDPGCVHPTEGFHTYPPDEYGYAKTIQEELNSIIKRRKPRHLICLFHCPPYNTNLDRAALDGKSFDYAPLDVHIGSIAIRRFIESYSPKLGLFGHVHESSRITGIRSEFLGRTLCINCSTDEESLCIGELSLDEKNWSAEFRLMKPTKLEDGKI